MSKKVPARHTARKASDLANLRARLADAEETLQAIRNGDVDALVVTAKGKEQVFTLQGAETPYRFLIEEMNEAALLLGPQGIIQYANARFAEWTQVPLERVIGACWESFFAAAEGQCKEWLRAAKTGSIRTEVFLRSEHSAPRPVGLSLSRIQRERIEGFSVVITDLTVQKQTEEALRLSEARERARRNELELLLEMAPTPFFIALDRDCRQLMGNRAARELLGITQDQPIIISAAKSQQPTFEARRKGVPIVPEDMTMQRATASGKPVLGDEVELVYPDGRSRFAICNAVPLLDEHGMVRGCLGATVDITEGKQREEALRATQTQLQAHAQSLEKTVQERTAELQAANEMLQREMEDRKRLEREVLTSVEREQRRLGQDLHDDLCQQLTAIEFFSQTLARALGRNDKTAAQQARQIAEMVRLATLQTRDLARGLSPLSLEADGLTLALKELAERTARVFRLECRFIDSGPVLVPDQAMGVHIYRIAQEAVTNAVKHSQARRVEIGLSAEGVGLTLRVSDNGVGISPDSAQGSGMGLRIMKYRAGMIGGSLSIETVAGSGTSVTCHITDGLLQAQERNRR